MQKSVSKFRPCLVQDQRWDPRSNPHPWGDGAGGLLAPRTLVISLALCPWILQFGFAEHDAIAQCPMGTSYVVWQDIVSWPCRRTCPMAI